MNVNTIPHKLAFSKDLIKLENAEKTVLEIAERLRYDVKNHLKRKGAVVGISGGIDSSVTLALAVKAFGTEKVIGILLPEKESNPESKTLALKLAHKFGIKTIEEDLTETLSEIGCYSRRDDAVKSVIPHFNPIKDKFKIEIKQSILNMKFPPLFYVTVKFANGNVESKLLPIKAYLQIVAASNFKQRCRMAMLYFHAESNHYAVIGTPNKHEVKQGFFVKYGDGGADVMPIAHLFKTQVYELAEFLKIPQEIINRIPTTDTYSAEQTQEEFFFQLPFEILDVMWYGWENGYSAEEVSSALDYSTEEVSSIFTSFERKSKTTEYLRTSPIYF